MSDAIFDLQDALSRLDGDMELLQSLFDMFIDDADTYLKEIDTAWSARDYEHLARAAHTLKGIMGTFSAHPAYEAAMQLEMAAKAQDDPACVTLIGSIGSEIRRLTAALPRS